jgi:hypothetical protein
MPKRLAKKEVSLLLFHLRSPGIEPGAHRYCSGDRTPDLATMDFTTKPQTHCLEL